MKNLFYTFCAVGLFGCSQAHTQVPQTDLEKMNLKGKVHTVELKSYMGDFSGHKSGHNAEGTSDQYLAFNEAGNLILKKEFDDSGATLIDTFLYDVKGRPVKENRVSFRPRSRVHTLRHEMRYDDAGKRIESHATSITNDVHGPDSSTLLSKFTYNSTGQLIRIDHSKNGQPESFNEYTYYANGLMKSNRHVNPTLGSEYVITYDEAGRPVERNLDGLLKTGFTYHPNGDKATVSTGPPPVTFTCTYEYDEHGNWIRQIQVPDNESYPYKQYTLMRTITYYQ